MVCFGGPSLRENQERNANHEGAREMTLTAQDLVDDFGPDLGPDDEVQDFSIPVKRLLFRFNGKHRYEASPMLGGKTLAKLAGIGARMEGLDTEGKLEVLTEAFDLMLLDESAARLRKRLDESKEDPVDFVRQAVPCFRWLMEQYTGKGTQASSDSSTGSAAAGSNSTAGAPLAASTRAGSLPDGSSTSSSTTGSRKPHRNTTKN